jgi:antitoxin component of MazEF toxin-antitoxin module
MPHEETRKIIKIGNSYGVTIPKAWLRYFKLDVRDQVRMVSNSTIVIEPPKKKAVECVAKQ